MAKREAAGWIKIHRQILDHWIFQDEIKFRCWVDILFTVNTEDKKVNIGLQLFDCKRGQSLLSIQSWASRWRMSKSAAKNLLILLQKEKMITLENLVKSTRLTVCKYEDYQYSTLDKNTHETRKAITTKDNIIINNNIEDLPFANAFKDFIKMRDKMRKPLTEKAINIILSKLEKYSEGDTGIKIQIINQSIEHAWLSVFPLKPENFKPKAQNLNNQAINLTVAN